MSSKVTESHIFYTRSELLSKLTLVCRNWEDKRKESKRVSEKEGIIKSCKSPFENGEKMLRKTFSPDRFWRSGSVWYKTQRTALPNTLGSIISRNLCPALWLQQLWQRTRTARRRTFSLCWFASDSKHKKRAFKESTQGSTDLGVGDDFRLFTRKHKFFQKYTVEAGRSMKATMQLNSCRSKKRLSDRLEHLIRDVCKFTLTLLTKSLDGICF